MSTEQKNLLKQAEKCIEPIKKAEKALIISHIDADGLTSAAIASKALSREGIKHKIDFVKSLEPKKIKEIKKHQIDLILFTDLGSSLTPQLKKIEPDIVICDHHQPQHEPNEKIWELNPHHHGINGSTEISGASTTHTLATTLNPENQETADLAIVGSVGDIQDSSGKLIGINREILKKAQENNIIKTKKDIRLFGKQTRPIHKLLEYSSDPYIPGITGKEENCIKLIKNQNIPLKKEGKWRRWIDLNEKEKKAIVSSLINKALEKGISEKMINRLIGEVYILQKEKPGTELRDASEYSTLLNATARYNHSKTGLQLCLGKRNQVYKEAKNLLKNHRKNLVDGIKYIEQKNTQKLENIQYIDCENKIKDTIVGIVAGMALGSNKINRNLPIIALADKNEDKKISARTTQKMIYKGVNLGEAIAQAAETVNGNGGGHNIAAGATIPKTKQKQFLKKLDNLITNQIKN
ncbi:Single-stranded DNA-specific exonuclease RecJ [Methanonatronarchaeum thermophilum]|uniref:Single-stranded DNA-specific exonuclease RecJ n=1 Tax=Methanonatronarchaeum thermophilum TaxID=1927129 RepID=A0A1Y3GBA3_9EURY|nr:DHH family phosphoesterase [Methanonatronarchaeum thermophilum]OUJ18699.1 Single-stranded DNA-specific exonuclease RecJ [Methanonatronarchaeum thermophilum]